MEASEIFGLVLLSVVVIFITAGYIFIVADVYKERRKKGWTIGHGTNPLRNDTQ